jgi:flagellar biosynthesis/type III secretory pathway protein FliH
MKIRLPFKRQSAPQYEAVAQPKEKLYTPAELEQAYHLGYTDGRKEGLRLAQQAASNSLKDILWQQNKQAPKRNQPITVPKR